MERTTQCGEGLPIGVGHRGRRQCGVDQSFTAGQFERHVEVGRDLRRRASPPGLQMIDPTDHVEFEAAELGRHDHRRESVVAERVERLFLPWARLAGRGHGAPSDRRHCDVVAVGEHVGHDAHRFAEGRLGGEGTAVDDRSDRFDDHA